MSAFTMRFEELSASLSELKFNVSDISQKFTTTTLYTPLLLPHTSDKAKITIDKRERTFQTDAPVFLRRLDFYGVNAKDVELTVYTSEGVSKKIPVIQFSNYSQAVINEFCVKFAIRSKAVLAKVALSSVSALGFEFKEQQKTRNLLAEFVTAHFALTRFLAASKKTVEDQDAALEEIKALTTELTEIRDLLLEESAELQSEVDSTKNSISALNSSVKASEAVLFSLNTEITAKSNNSQQLDRETKSLNDKVADLHLELSRLVNDRSIISDEFTDFVSEGKGQAGIYLKLMILPVFVIGLCVAMLFNGANNLIVGHYETSKDVVAAILLRIPFAAAVGGAIYYSWMIGSSFMNKIFSIQEERLVLAKLLVLAKNTVFSTAEDLGIDAKEKFHLRTRLKIEMLKSHLAKNLGQGVTMSELEAKLTPESKSTENATNSDDQDSGATAISKSS